MVWSELRPFAASAISTARRQKDLNEEPLSQSVSKNLYLVLGRHDPDQCHAVCGCGDHTSNSNRSIVARCSPGWGKRAKGCRTLRTGWFVFTGDGNSRYRNVVRCDGHFFYEKGKELSGPAVPTAG